MSANLFPSKKLTPQQVGLLSAAVPSPFGDALGLLADTAGYVQDPASLTPGRGLLSLAALAPGVPSLQGKTLFHGTYGKAFDEFKGRGGTTWLSEAADHAAEYARGGRRSLRGVKPGARIHPVKADVTNPLDITDIELGGNATLADIAKKTGVSEDDLAARIRKYAEQDPNFQNDLKAGLIPSKTGIGFAGPIKGVGPGWSETMQWFRWFDHKPVTMALRDLGFDGVQAVEHYGKERKAAMTLGVFDSPKIKSIWDVQ